MQHTKKTKSTSTLGKQVTTRVWKVLPIRDLNWFMSTLHAFSCVSEQVLATIDQSVQVSPLPTTTGWWVRGVFREDFLSPERQNHETNLSQFRGFDCGNFDLTP